MPVESRVMAWAISSLPLGLVVWLKTGKVPNDSFTSASSEGLVPVISTFVLVVGVPVVEAFVSKSPLVVQVT